MLLKHLFCFVLVFSLMGNLGLALGASRIDDLISNDRDERIKKINEITIQLNLKLEELTRFKSELQVALERSRTSGRTEVMIRNTAGVVAAVGLISTILYQSKGINPSKIILSGGYALSTLAIVISYFQNKTIQLSTEEIARLQASVSDLEKRVDLEKRNLAREIRLLCLSDGGMPEFCDGELGQ